MASANTAQFQHASRCSTAAGRGLKERSWWEGSVCTVRPEQGHANGPKRPPSEKHPPVPKDPRLPRYESTQAVKREGQGEGIERHQWCPHWERLQTESKSKHGQGQGKGLWGKSRFQRGGKWTTTIFLLWCWFVRTEKASSSSGWVTYHSSGDDGQKWRFSNRSSLFAMFPLATFVTTVHARTA